MVIDFLVLSYFLLINEFYIYNEVKGMTRIKLTVKLLVNYKVATIIYIYIYIYKSITTLKEDTLFYHI